MYHSRNSRREYLCSLIERDDGHEYVVVKFKPCKVHKKGVRCYYSLCPILSRLT